MPRTIIQVDDKSDRLSKEDWVAAALDALAAGGVTNVRIEVIAKSINVTKGSFYWHFKNRTALLTEMLRSWQHERTSAIGKMLRSRDSDARTRIAFLLRLASADRDDVPGGRIEQAIREWAHSSELARQALVRVDEERLSILTDLYCELGLPRQTGAAYAFLALSFLVGSNTIHREIGLQAVRTQREICMGLLFPNA